MYDLIFCFIDLLWGREEEEKDLSNYKWLGLEW